MLGWLAISEPAGGAEKQAHTTARGLNQDKIALVASRGPLATPALPSNHELQLQPQPVESFLGRQACWLPCPFDLDGLASV